MHILYNLLTQYYQLFGYSSCRNLTAVDKFLLFAIEGIAILIVAEILNGFPADLFEGQRLVELVLIGHEPSPALTKWQK
jgi:hypothetical protein